MNVRMEATLVREGFGVKIQWEALNAHGQKDSEFKSLLKLRLNTISQLTQDYGPSSIITTTNRPYTASCDSGWTERKFGSKTKCYKSLGKFSRGTAGQRCADIGAKLPLPRSKEEQADFVATMKSFGLNRLGNNCLIKI